MVDENLECSEPVAGDDFFEILMELATPMSRNATTSSLDRVLIERDLEKDVGLDNFEEMDSLGGDDIDSVIMNLEGNGNKGLSYEVVNLIGVDYIEPPMKRECVGEVDVVELHLGTVGIDVEVVGALGVEVGRPTDEAVDLVAIFEC
ncbi:hypothetical protein ACH5RR_007219 [Cinchona calisaya]|uniref:Uncharacterized protein n=1 Tax=Cinchona calisaya TaxID=153742 RepID=A0ABD3AR95_9GENT